MKNKILLLSATDYEHDCKDLFGIPIHITGIGKINAAINTTKLIYEHDPDIVINFGSCGNLKDYKIGEVLEVGTVINDLDTLGFYNQVSNILNKDSDIKCLTTDHMYDSSHDDYVESYMEKIDECDIVDMELFSIAESCKIAKKFLYSYKWVSDDGSNDEWLENAKAGFNNFKQIFKSKHL
jgi:adenosylhomocysteine nucleosidase|tara:strand:- start:367 stop:909 length:543 start_codon:yes stop_codon:yes gene_type:complete